MLNHVLNELNKNFKVCELDCKEYQHMEKKGFKFDFRSFKVEGFGFVSYSKMTAMFGLMKMESVIVVPYDFDYPLCNYDIVKVLKNRTLILEGYNTCKTNVSSKPFNAVLEKSKAFNKYVPEAKWYDSLKEEYCIYIKEKKKDNELLELSKEFFNVVLTESVKASKSDKDKLRRVSQYVNGLLDNGGASTDTLIKLFGKDKVHELYKKYMFGIE